MRVCGIDPGAQGALAIVDLETRVLVDVLDMPILETGKVDYADPATVLDWLERWAPHRLVVERPQTRPHESPISSMNMGIRFGSLIAGLRLSNIPLEMCASNAWKKRAGLPKGDTPTHTKKLSIGLARQTFGHPEQFRREKDHNRAEAALIALYGWKVETVRAAA